MLIWNSNFQIPNSGVQAANVYMFAELDLNILKLSFYSDSNRANILWTEELEVYDTIDDIYDYILSLEKYNQYKKA